MTKNGGITIQPPNKVIPQEWLLEGVPDFDLWFIIAGQATLIFEDERRMLLSRGSCLLLRPGVKFDLYVGNEAGLTTAWMHFDLLDEQGRELVPDEVAAPPVCGEIYDTHYFEAVFRRLIFLGYEGDRAGATRAYCGMLLKVLLHEFEMAVESQEGFAKSGGQRHHRSVVASTLSWLHSHPDQLTSAGALAERFGYSLKHFSRIFREIAGKTPTQAIIEARIDHAKRQLADSTLTVSEIAANLGYENIFYFSKQFKQVMGVSPSQFRERLLSDGENIVKDELV